MAFKTLFIALAPDADPETRRNVIETDEYKITTVVVMNEAQALEVCRGMTAGEGINAVWLCPGFTHREIADISEAVGSQVAVAVARGDDPSHKIVAKVLNAGTWGAFCSARESCPRKPGECTVQDAAHKVYRT